MPPFESVKDQVLELRVFVNRLQAALKALEATPEQPKGELGALDGTTPHTNQEGDRS
jgi:hypothetical protein